jgi:PAS domain S-box-containing protein
MIADDFLSHVPKVWYRIHWFFLVLINTAILGGGAAGHFLLHLEKIATQFNLNNTTTLVLSSATLVYLLGVFWFVRKASLALATVAGAMLTALVILNGLTNTDPSTGAILYIVLWLLTTALAGIYGLSSLLGSIMLSAIYVVLQGRFHPEVITTDSWLMLGGSVAIGLLSYPFWRRRFVNSQDQQMNQLSGMLKTNQTQSAILIQSIADGVIVTNTEGQITLMNRAASNMTGWTAEEAVGVDVKMVVKVTKEDGSEVSETDYPFTAVLVHKAFINRSLQIASRDGKKKQIISLVISPVVTGSGEVYGAVAVMRDVSEERAAEKQSAEFISTASHEMRTPVAAIEGYLALALNEKVSTIDARGRGFLEKAHSSTQHLGQLFQDLLTSAKAEDGRLTNHPTVVEMGAFLEQLVEDLRFAAQKKGLATEFVVGSNEAIDATKSDEESGGRRVVKPLYYVFADADRVREVITNLFDNACKYTEAGKISLGLTGNGDVVQLYIRDTGSGIPAEDIPHLFQKFYRVDSSATRTIGGTGLGLFICRKIVEMYQGRLWVESQLGKGSTFFINLPRLSTQKAQELQQAAADAPPAS